MSSAIIIGKLIAFFLQLFSSKGGTALPGLIALKINPNLIRRLAEKNQLQSIIITGTNGKTTTSRLLGSMLQAQNIPFLHNRSGSNLLRGIASTLINQSDTAGWIKTKLAIWEIDEAVVPIAIQQLQPKIILFNNLSRDQLDRYGELDTLLKSWQQSLSLHPKNTQVFINQTDQNLKTLHSPQIIYFGQALPPGEYFQANILAAQALARSLKLKPASIHQGLKSFQPAFGRGETFTYHHKQIKISLVKNPAGFTAVLNQLQHNHQLNQPLLIALNDLIADGADVSWIWDANLEILKNRRTPIIVSGLRAADLALRLKYAGINETFIQIQPRLHLAWQNFISQPGSVGNILPTYTAMLSLRQLLSQQKIIHSSWQD
ncbi:MAG: MurT ligase domain-containing protein [Patescibacteria group bacterium]|nr:MurT ligase domain-containing protein [Patescibacteria group bacterium]